jgi:hypothetical protein
MKKQYLLYALIVCCTAITSCTKDSGSVSAPKAIVEAYLAPNSVASVHITTEILYTTSDTSAGIENLNVVISCNGISYTLASQGNGYYVADTSLHIVVGNTYTLEFTYNDEIVSSSTVIPAKPTAYTASASSITVQQFDPNSGTMPTFPDPIELDWDNANHDYYLIVVKNIESTLVPTDTVNINNRAFRTEPTQSNTYKIQAMQFKYYGTHQVILYKLNAEYAALYNDNGSNSLNLTSPVTNITNGFGIFTGINADTLYIEVTN